MSSPEPVGRRQEREREILDAAAKLFRAQGYASTTIRDIGVEARLNHASSHYYFGSKAAILTAICREALDGFLERFEAIPDTDPTTTLTEIVRAAVIEAARRPDHTAVFFQERRWLTLHLDPRQAASVLESRDRFRTRTEAVVERGIRDGGFVPIDPALVTELVVGAATWAYQHVDQHGVHAAADRCAHTIVTGLLAERSRPR